MAYVIKNSKGHYGKGSNKWSATWVEDIGDARTFPNKGAAVSSLRATFASKQFPEKTLTAVPVTITEKPNV